MELKLLNKTELTDLYRTDLVRDFPKTELKPLKGMLSLMDRGKYDPLVVTDGEKVIGYAMVWLPLERKGALLEYFGVRPEYRNGGVGGQVLTKRVRLDQPCGVGGQHLDGDLTGGDVALQ